MQKNRAVLVGVGSAVAAALIFAVSVYFISRERPGQMSEDRLLPGRGVQDVSSLKVSTPAGGYTIKSTGAGGFEVQDMAGVPMLEGSAYSAVKSFVELRKGVVENEHPAQSALYGLASPEVTIEASLSGGEQVCVEASGGRDGFVYWRVQGEQSIRKSPQSHFEAFRGSQTQFADLDIGRSIEYRELKRLEITTASGEEYLIEEEKSPAGQGGELRLTKPQSGAVDSEVITALLERIESLRANDIAAVRPTAAEMKQYGMDSPELTLRINWGDSEVSYRCGGISGLQTHVMVDNIPAVYLAPVDAFPFELLSHNTLTAPRIAVPPLDELSVMQIITDGEYYEFKISGENEERQVSFAGSRVDFVQFAAYLRALSQIGGISPSFAARGAPDLILVFHLSGEQSDPQSVSFYNRENGWVMSLHEREYWSVPEEEIEYILLGAQRLSGKRDEGDE